VRAVLDLLHLDVWPKLDSPRLHLDLLALDHLADFCALLTELGFTKAALLVGTHLYVSLRKGTIHGLPAILMATHLRRPTLIADCIRRPCYYRSDEGGPYYGTPGYPCWLPCAASDEVDALFPMWAHEPLRMAYHRVSADRGR
jgi:hypothetical protein